MRSAGSVALAALALALALAAVAVAATRGAAPSFRRDVAPILSAKCAACHRPGGIAPFSLEDAREASRRAPAIARMVSARLMPPWPPGPLSPAFAGAQARTLSEAERETIVRWARAGGRVDGRALKARPAPAVRPAPGERVVTLRLPLAYRPASVSADDYRCFLLDPQLGRDAFVTSAAIRPGASRVVHHVILFRADPKQVARAQALDAAAPGQGWTCFGGTGLSGDATALADAGWISAWAPGSAPVRFRDGVGVRLGAGSRIVMQVHYNLSNGRVPDRSSAVLTLAAGDAPLTPASTTLLPAPVELACAQGENGRLCGRDAAIADLVRKYGAGAAWIPAGLLALCGGDAAAPRPSAVSTCTDRFDARTAIHAVAGHMHLLGASIRVELNPGTPRARVLLDIPRWDFRWQAAYTLATPVVAEPGDAVRVTCRYDVSRRTGAPRYVVWGEGTADEMCLAILQVTRG